MTNERILGLSRYCAKLAGQVAVTYSNMEDAIGALSRATQHLDEIGDTLDKISISLAEAAKAEEQPKAAVRKTKAVPKAAPAPAAKKQAAKPATKPEAKKPAPATAKEEKKGSTPGVTWDKNRKKWAASYRNGVKKVFVGRYETEEKAVAAWRRRRRPP